MTGAGAMGKVALRHSLGQTHRQIRTNLIVKILYQPKPEHARLIDIAGHDLGLTFADQHQSLLNIFQK